jgi:hypothetical protein
MGGAATLDACWHPESRRGLSSVKFRACSDQKLMQICRKMIGCGDRWLPPKTAI